MMTDAQIRREFLQTARELYPSFPDAVLQTAADEYVRESADELRRTCAIAGSLGRASREQQDQIILDALQHH